ncbi:MAG: hypothetical protein ACPGQL_03255 [Thermoplasmatota archaeon]
MKTTTTLAALLLIASTALVATPQAAAVQKCITSSDAVTIALNHLVGLTPEQVQDALAALDCPQHAIQAALCALFGPGHCYGFAGEVELEAAGVSLTIGPWKGEVYVEDDCWRTSIRAGLDCRAG